MMKPQKINVISNVKIKLTEEGIEFFRKEAKEHFAEISSKKDIKKLIDTDGFIKMNFSFFMICFGGYANEHLSELLDVDNVYIV